MEANEIKEIREKLGLTQQQLAVALGVAIRTVQNWENGRPVPNTALAKLRLLTTKKSHIAPDHHDLEQALSVVSAQQELISKHANEVAALYDIITRKDEQIDRLLLVIEKITNPQR